jgi:acyl-CoA synthetase (AMP-forming)/AMP-acid ligase II
MLGELEESLESPPEAVIVGGAGATSFERIIEQESTAALPAVIDLDLAAIIYTSGSTGDPKGVTMSHRNMVSASTSITTYLENVEDDIILNTLPFSFDYGLYQLIMSMQMGATLVLEKTFGFPYQIIEHTKKYQVTGLPCVPTIFALLLQLESLEDENLDCVRYISNTAAALPPNYIPRLQKIFPRARIYSMYGLTECKRVSYLPPDRVTDKPDSVGIAMPNTEVWVVDEQGNELPRGKVGELVVRGGSVMRGYWRDPEATTERLKPGRYPWETVLYTGDLFRMDNEGFLYFVARKDDIIKCRGERVHPKEIETVLYSMDEILNARVIGVPHEIYGQAIKAEIIPREGARLDERKVRAYCRKHLEDLMVPQFIEFVKELPVSTSGKIKRT